MDGLGEAPARRRMGGQRGRRARRLDLLPQRAAWWDDLMHDAAYQGRPGQLAQV